MPEPPPSTGGTDGEDGACGPGLMVVGSSDYQSTSVAFVGWDGEVISPHVLSSGSTESGLSAPLSGDVVAPTMASAGSEVVLVDRYPASVLTWVDEASGVVQRQLSLRTGFAANAQDYVAVSADKGYASRYEANPAPGREPFDAGSDVLVLDPRSPAIVGRIGFEDLVFDEAEGLLPAPSRLVASGDRLVVLLSVYSRNFQTSGDGRLAIVDTTTDTIVAVHRLEGLRGCSALAPSPARDRVAVGCSGTFGGGAVPTLDDAGVVVVAIDTGEVEARIPASALGAPPAFSLAFASEELLLVPTFGSEARDGGGATGDALFRVSLAGDAPESLLRSAEPFMLGEIRCAAACGACFLADAEQGLLRRFTVQDGLVQPAEEVHIDDGLDAPPRYLGSL